MKGRFAMLAAATLLAGCGTRVDTDARAVFERAFGDIDPPFLVVAHGYRYSRLVLGMTRDEVWLLHLRGGAAANQALASRWPDLEEVPRRPDDMTESSLNPWFMPPADSYLYWKSPSDPGVTVAQEFPSQDLYVRYAD